MTTQLWHYTDIQTDHHDLLTLDQVIADLNGILHNLELTYPGPWETWWRVGQAIDDITAGNPALAAVWLLHVGIDLTPADELVTA